MADKAPRVGVPLAEAARRLGLTPKAMRKRVRQGKGLWGYKDGDEWYVVGLPLGASAPTPLPAPTATAPDETLGLSERLLATLHDIKELFHAQRAADTSQTQAREAITRELVDSLKGEVAFLRRELEARGEEIRRRDHIIAGLTSRLPELPAGAPPAEPELRADPEPAASASAAPEQAAPTAPTSDAPLADLTPATMPSTATEPGINDATPPAERSRRWRGFWRRG